MMEPLSGMDAGFLYMETDELAMHTLKVAIMDPSGVEGGVSLGRYANALEKRLRSLPAFRQRIIEIPLGLGHPVWVQDENFDVARHVKHRQVRAPGGQAELDELISEITEHALPRDRPLWEITMVEGLEGGRIAFVAKIHHSLADGTAALEMLRHVFEQPGHAAEPPAAQGLPTTGDLMRVTGRETWSRIRSLPSLVRQTVRGLTTLGHEDNKMARDAVPKPFTNPALPFNASLTSKRSFVSLSLPLDEVLLVKRALHVTVNDVFLGICGGALRAYLEQRDALPERPALASIPINTQPQITGRLRGNHVGNLLTSLCTDIEDPIERLQAITVITRASKWQQQTIGADIYERWFHYTPPRLYAAAVRFWSRHHLANRFRGPINLVVSNVRGPSEKISIDGVKLEAFYSVGPILDGVGLNITGWSYSDRLNLVALACPTNFPDLRDLVDLIPVALSELVDACEASDPLASGNRGAHTDTIEAAASPAREVQAGAEGL